MNDTCHGRDRFPYVISGDSHGLLKRWAVPRELSIPPYPFFQDMAAERSRVLERLFSLPCIHLDEVELAAALRDELRRSDLPIIALDQNYLDGLGIPLEMTRLCDPKTLECAGRIGSRTAEPLPEQLDAIARRLGPARVQLGEDVIYSGSDLANDLILELAERRVTVARITAAVVVGRGKVTIKERWPEIDIAHVRYYPEVCDEICERDFLAGVPQGGRLLGTNGVPLFPKACAPYFHPFAHAREPRKCFMNEWATLNSATMPAEVRAFSRFCLEQSIALWQEIERISGRRVHCAKLERRPWGIPCDDSFFVDHLKCTLAEL